MFRMSTTRTSPGSAPFTWIGPLKTWFWSRSMSRMSLAESLFPTWPFVQSRHSMRKSVPGSAEAAGMSGCQRLCPGTSWSAMDVPISTLKRDSSPLDTPRASRPDTTSEHHFLALLINSPPSPLYPSLRELLAWQSTEDETLGQREVPVPIYEFLC